MPNDTESDQSLATWKAAVIRKLHEQSIHSQQFDGIINGLIECHRRDENQRQMLDQPPIPPTCN